MDLSYAVEYCREDSFMIRRRLFAYSVMMTAGITSGFFIMQKASLLSGSLFLMTAGLSVCLMTADRDEILKLTIALLSGFLLFTFSFISYESDFSKLSAVDEERIVLLEGKAVRIKSKGDTYNLEIADAVISVSGADEAGTEEESAELPREKNETTYEEQISLRYNIQASYKGDKSAEHEMIRMVGSHVILTGFLRQPQDADNPGCFDYRLYLRSCGIGYSLKARSVVCPEIKGGYRQKSLLMREQFLDRFEDESVRSFIKGSIFGDKGDMDDEVREEFNVNNTGHILAVSGLHIGFLYVLLRMLSRNRRSLPMTLLIIAIIVLYGDMTLWSASAVRAVLVLSISLMASYVMRPFDLLTAVSAAAVLILFHEPYQLFNTGFQMSFMALLGIAFLSKPISFFTGEYLAVMLSVQLGVAPLAAFVFHRFNPLSIFINIPVIAIASVLVPVCMSTLLISNMAGAFYVPTIFTDALVKLSAAIAELILRLNSLLAGEGGFSFNMTRISPGLLILFYLMLFMAASEWARVFILRKEYTRLICAVLCISMISSAAYAASFDPFADDEIVFVSVGQGDCTHIRAGKSDILIDGGGRADYNVGSKILMPYLLSNGTDSVELAAVTHLHMDHYKGIFELSEVFPVGSIGIPSDYRKSLEKRYLSEERHEQDKDGSDEEENQGEDSVSLPDISKVLYLEQGIRMTISDNVYIEPLWPLAGSKEISLDDPNENNMVYMVHYNGIRIMVTGDLLEEDEISMLEHYRGTDMLKCDVLKVAHHGSKSSSSEAFLDAADPEIAVIQVGRNNFYGHPHAQTIECLEERGIRIYRTDVNGAVGIDIHRSKLKIDTMR